jgi:hypothetical protein
MLLFFYSRLVFCLLILIVLVCLTPKALFASDDIDFACKSTGSSSFNSCWDMSKPASCVYVLNLDTNKVDTSNIYCNSGLACKYKNQQYSCKTTRFRMPLILLLQGTNKPERLKMKCFWSPVGLR